MEFNKEQLEAISSIEGTVQLISSAGSGKSTVLIERICNMVNNHNIKESDILAISFTNASATDLKDKLKEKEIEVESGTFHSICKKLLTEKNIDTTSFPNKYQFKRELETRSKEKNINVDDVLSWIGYQQGYNLDCNEYSFKDKESLYDTNQLRLFYKIYEDFKKKTKTKDFNDWLKLVHSMYQSGEIIKKWKYVSVDENQDQNTIQYLLAEDFCEDNNVFVVGDEKQALYEFNAAVPELFRNFSKTHKDTKVINMYMNYRSCKNIVNSANNFIRPYFEKYGNYKDSEAFNKEDGIIECKSYSTAESEAHNVVNKIEELHKQGVDLNEIAVIYRNNAMADYVENELKKRKVDYQIFSNSSFFDRKEIKGILSVLRLVVDSNDDEAFETLVKEARFYPCTYFQGSLVDDLRTEAGKKDCSLFEAFMDHRWKKDWEHRNANMLIDFINRLKIQNEKHLSNDKIIDNVVKMFQVKNWLIERTVATAIQDKLDGINNLKNISMNSNLEGFVKYCNGGGVNKTKNKDGVKLMTCHGSKGLEFKVTFVISLMENKFPSEKANLESEARLMYVAITRAKEQLYLSCIGGSEFYSEYKKGVDKLSKK